jgi:hypothetical protein
MFRKRMYTLNLAMAVLVVAASVALAATTTPTNSKKKSSTLTAQSMTMAGTVTGVDKKGLATVQIKQGTLKMQGKGLHLGDKVACSTQQGRTVCKKA